MKFKVVALVLALALFVEEVRHFIEIGGLTNVIATSLGKMIVYCMVVALISLDFATNGNIWTSIDMAMKLTN